MPSIYVLLEISNFATTRMHPFRNLVKHVSKKRPESIDINVDKNVEAVQIGRILKVKFRRVIQGVPKKVTEYYIEITSEIYGPETQCSYF